VITSCSHTDTGTCVSRPFSYLKWTADQCDPDPTGMMAICDRRASTIRLVNTAESIFNRVPSTDK
jgi:hypothetical protein